MNTNHASEDIKAMYDSPHTAGQVDQVLSVPDIKFPMTVLEVATQREATQTKLSTKRSVI